MPGAVLRLIGRYECGRGDERSVRRLANRLAKMKDVDRELLTTLQPEDIEVAGVVQAHLSAMADEPGSVRVTCDECGAAQVILDKLLGTKVPCEGCDQSINADWGEPVAELPKPREEADKSGGPDQPTQAKRSG